MFEKLTIKTPELGHCRYIKTSELICTANQYWFLCIYVSRAPALAPRPNLYLPTPALSLYVPAPALNFVFTSPG